MASDLAAGARTDLEVELCGDAHLSNFGSYATPERRLIFDLNDFDETLPGPFEWDVKRLVASFEVAGQHSAFTPAQRSEIVATVADEYRAGMAEFAGMTRLDVWYARMQAEDILNRWFGQADDARIASFQKVLAKGRKKTSSGAASRYTVQGPDGDLRVISDPPFVEPVGAASELPKKSKRGELGRKLSDTL